MARAVESAVWWVVLVGVWLTTLNALNWQDLLVAAVAAAPCALVATLVRGVYRGQWRPASAWSLPVAVAQGCAALFSRRTALRRIATSSTRKAVRTVIVSASPGTVVLDDEGDSLLVHALGDE
jgi:multisubunit Na+/H+ antiporter MnhE subunit